MAEKHSSSVAFYIIIALILGAITYLEFAIVEHPVAWLGRGGTVAALVGMSLIKFGLVVAIYMHLRDDDRTYTGFFSSGMVLALGTFVALSFLFTVRSVAREPAVLAEAVPEVAGTHEAAQLLESHESTGGHGVVMVQRPLAEQLRVPPPKSQRLDIPLPSAPRAEYSLSASAPLNVTQPPAATSEPLAQAEAASFDWQQLGEETYSANCTACHQATGQGVPGAFPPLAGHLPELYGAEGGRSYMIHVVLYGLQGEITVQGVTYNGVMPAFAQLSDEQVAATLNHELSSWGNDALIADFEPITPEEVAAEREAGLTAAQVHDSRPTLTP